VRRSFAVGLLVVALVSLLPAAASAQEIEPRTFANTPVGLNFIAVGYTFQSGNVLFDSSLPIEDVNADLHMAFTRYLRTLPIGNKPAKLTVVLPLVAGHWEGFLEQEFRTRDANGMADLRFGLDILLWGAEARRASEPAIGDRDTVVGAGVVLVVPSGTYDSERLINLGSNRWSLRSQVGVAHKLGRWTVEVMGAVWLFSDNDDFFGGQHLDQSPLYVLKGDVVYSFRPGMWVGLGAGYGEGATSRIDGVVRNTLQTNWRFGGTFAYAIRPQHGISVTAFSGLTTRVGADFDSFGFAYQYLWGDR